jgi:hypothetical protein
MVSANEAKSCDTSLENISNYKMKELKAEACDNYFDRQLKYELAEKRWESLYDKEGSKN